MRIFVPSYIDISNIDFGDVAANASVVREDAKTSTKKNIEKLLTCEMICADENVETHSESTSAYIAIAKACGIDIIGLTYKSEKDYIVHVCSEYYGIDCPLGDCGRTAQATTARFMAAYLLDKMQISHSMIGHKLGRNRSTVFFYIKRSYELMDVDKSFRKDYQNIIDMMDSDCKKYFISK